MGFDLRVVYRRTLKHMPFLRHILIAVAALLALAAFVAPAQAAEVVVNGPDNTETIDLEDIDEPDIDGVEYKVRASDGEITKEPVTGYSLAEVLAEAGFNSFAIATAEIERPNGTTISLGKDQVNNTGDYYGPDRPPAVRIVDEKPAFIRSTDAPSDNNAKDVFTVPSGALEITLTKNDAPVVEATASDYKVRAGDKINFVGKVLSDHTNLDYRWSFGSQGTSVKLNPSFTFEKEGTYGVGFSATDPATGLEGFDTFNIEVGEPKESDEDRDGGGEEDDGDTTGVVTPPYVPPYIPPSYDPSDYPTGSTDIPKVSDGDKKPKPAPAGEQVEGELLDDTAAEAVTPAPEEEQASPVLQSGTPQEDDDGGPSVPGAVAAGATVLGLLGLGALTEMGGPLPSRLPRPTLPGGGLSSLPRPRWPFGGR